MSALFVERKAGRCEARGEFSHHAANTQTFAEWHWDGEELAARNCAFGFQPLFWRRLEQGVALATSPLDLLSSPVALDYEALSVFVRLGFFVGEDTPFTGVRQLPPGSELRWSLEQGLRLRSAELPRNPITTLTRAQAMERYAELFRTAVGRCLPVDGRLCLPLSGGRDSRHLAFALHKLGARAERFVTLKHLPGRNNEDARIAGLLADALGVPHTVLSQPRWYVRNMLAVQRDCGFCADEGGQLPPLRTWLAQHCDALFDGIGGDVMSAGLFQNEKLHELYLSGDLEEVAAGLFDVWRTGTRGWQYAADPELLARLDERTATARLVKELRRHCDHPNPARSFYFWNRTRREMALQPFLLLDGLKVETPFLDRELWNFLDSLPWEFVRDENFHTETLRHAYPEFAAISFESKAARPRVTRLQRMALGLQVLHALVERPGTLRKAALMQALRLSAGFHVWWNPAMLLYLSRLLTLGVKPVSSDAAGRDRPRHARAASG